ncbi:hypothetical protein [Cytophaga aurantiaca]|uniref:hypothetical protein n=1 Tax=Cytophaga aurantiaca TaxID=29530 RepID=UPI000380CE49|nr:hypothetical protein [Cytophaga aurantiaca]
MKHSASYKYYLRPGYGSEKLLIEFISGVEEETFMLDLFDALKHIKAELVDLNDLWMNDEVLYSMRSALGEFTLFKDIWNLAFIMADHNQDCISKINELLVADKRFEKIEVNFDDYKTIKS